MDASDGHDYDACPDQSIFSDHVGPHSDDVTCDQCPASSNAVVVAAIMLRIRSTVVIAPRCKGIFTGR
jgi:hypothetical protein